jgi:hypothetical protein
MQASKAITDFWRMFELRREALAQVTSGDDPVYDELLEQLQHIHAGLYFQLSTHPGDRELIITAEGDSSLFALVDSIVAAAPATNGWKFLALRPKLGLPKTVQWEGYTVKLAEVRFQPLSDPETGELGLQLLIPGLNEENAEDVHNALLRALDHGLGEREFAETIQFTDVAALEESADETLALTDLEGFIEWHRKKASH